VLNIDWQMPKMEKRHTDNPSRPPLMRHDENAKRMVRIAQILDPFGLNRLQSAPSVPTYISSPNAMDVDPKTPRAADDEDLLAVDFNEHSPLPKPVIGPIPATRKRSLVCLDSSPGPHTSGSAGPSSPLGARPPMRHAASTNSAASGSLGRRRGSANQSSSGHGSRPSLSSTFASFHGGAGTGSAGIDEQQPLKKARPHILRAGSSRRTQSVCDVTSGTIAAGGPARVLPPMGLGRPTSLAAPKGAAGSSFFGAAAAAGATDDRRVVSANHASPEEVASTWEPAWGSESDGKALQCHGVQDDGLMRITPETVRLALAVYGDIELTSHSSSMSFKANILPSSMASSL
jgi:hypothetical protein